MTTQHPTRKAMIAAARSARVSFEPHLKECAECRDLFELFRAFPLSGEIALSSAPSGWVARAASLAESKVRGVVQKLVAKLTFDSWTAAPALGIRGPESGKRRLQFSAENLTFDLQAARKADKWQMTARVAATPDDTSAVQLIVNKQNLFPDDQGYFVWTSSRPPSRLTIRRDKQVITVPTLTWSAPKK